jgi:hypothetical protein
MNVFCNSCGVESLAGLFYCPFTEHLYNDLRKAINKITDDINGSKKIREGGG